MLDAAYESLAIQESDAREGRWTAYSEKMFHMIALAEDSIDPKQVYEEYISLPKRRSLLTPDVPAKVVEYVRNSDIDSRRELAEKIDFSGSRYRLKCDILKYYAPKSTGIYSFRVIYWAYPNTKWNTYGVNLWPRVPILSPPIAVIVR